MVDRALGEDELRGDLRVAKALGDEREHLELARREAARVLAGRRPRAAREAADATLTKARGDDGGRGLSAELLELVERVS